MSLYIEVTNRIKEHFSAQWLTPSQLRVYEQLRMFLVPPFRVVNIFGKEGVGKTFLGWVLGKDGIGEYVPSPAELSGGFSTYIVDNCKHGRSFVRGLRNILQAKGIERVILLTRYPADDSVPRLELDLTPDDIQVFKANLFRIDVRLPEIKGANLWDYLRSLGGEYQ